MRRCLAGLSETVESVDHVYLIPDGLLNIAPFPAMMTVDGDYLIDRLDIQILTSARDLIPSERRRARVTMSLLLALIMIQPMRPMRLK